MTRHFPLMIHVMQHRYSSFAVTYFLLLWQHIEVRFIFCFFFFPSPLPLPSIPPTFLPSFLSLSLTLTLPPSFISSSRPLPSSPFLPSFLSLCCLCLLSVSLFLFVCFGIYFGFSPTSDDYRLLNTVWRLFVWSGRSLSSNGFTKVWWARDPAIFYSHPRTFFFIAFWERGRERFWPVANNLIWKKTNTIAGN